MTMTKRGMNIKQGLAKAMLLVLLFLVGGKRPCETLCLQGMVDGVWAL